MICSSCSQTIHAMRPCWCDEITPSVSPVQFSARCLADELTNCILDATTSPSISHFLLFVSGVLVLCWARKHGIHDEDDDDDAATPPNEYHIPESDSDSSTIYMHILDSVYPWNALNPFQTNQSINTHTPHFSLQPMGVRLWSIPCAYCSESRHGCALGRHVRSCSCGCQAIIPQEPCRAKGRKNSTRRWKRPKRNGRWCR